MVCHIFFGFPAPKFFQNLVFVKQGFTRYFSFRGVRHVPRLNSTVLEQLQTWINQHCRKKFDTNFKGAKISIGTSLTDSWVPQTEISMACVSIISTFQIEFYIKGYHEYKDIWVPKVSEKLRCRAEPENIVDKYAVCVLLRDKVVGHLKKEKSGRFAYTITIKTIRVLRSSEENL